MDGYEYDVDENDDEINNKKLLFMLFSFSDCYKAYFVR